MKPFIPKTNPEIPDYYTAKVWFVGEQNPVTLKLVAHRTVELVHNDGSIVGIHPVPYLEYTRREDDKIGFFPLSSIKYIEFDKNFTKLKELAIKELAKRENKIVQQA